VGAMNSMDKTDSPASMMTFHTELSASREHNTTHMLLLQLCAMPVTLGVFCFSKLD